MRSSAAPSARGAAGGVLIDANLLLVLLTGLVNPKLVGSTKRTTQYRPGPVLWALLADRVATYSRVIVTPNVLTEVSNLATPLSDQLRAQFYGALAQTVSVWPEVYVESAAAMQHPVFLRLGLTDAALATLAGRPPAVTVLTSDAALYEAVWSAGATAENFWHLAAAAGLV